MKANERGDRTKTSGERDIRPSDDRSELAPAASADDSVDESPDNASATPTTPAPNSSLRLLPPLSEYPSRNEQSAILFGFVVMAIALVAMIVMAVQRPMTYSEMADTAPWPDARLNINTATEAELTVLYGIGPRLAERIVDDRELNGPFDSLDDLTRVWMIGPRTVESIRPYVMVGPAEENNGVGSD